MDVFATNRIAKRLSSGRGGGLPLDQRAGRPPNVPRRRSPRRTRRTDRRPCPSASDHHDETGRDEDLGSFRISRPSRPKQLSRSDPGSGDSPHRRSFVGNLGALTRARPLKQRDLLEDRDRLGRAPRSVAAPVGLRQLAPSVSSRRVARISRLLLRTFGPPFGPPSKSALCSSSVRRSSRVGSRSRASARPTRRAHRAHYPHY